MRAIYNGVDLMGLTTTHEFDIRPIYDDSQVDYLYSRVTLLDEFVINSQLTAVGPPASYKLDEAPPITGQLSIRETPNFVPTPFPPNAAGLDFGDSIGEVAQINIVPNAPALTLRDIQHRLITPQGKLYIFNGPGMESGSPEVSTAGAPQSQFAHIIVEAPAEGAEVDCNNGPKPQLLKIRQDEGNNTFIALWGVETYINEADRNGVQPISGLISNRFSQTHTVDKHGWSTVRTEGTAIFRTDLVYGSPLGDIEIAPASPDSFRASVFLPIPLGFTREIEYVRGSNAVNGLEYAYTDTQCKTNFVAGPYVNPDKPGTGAAEITIVHRQSITTDADVLGGALAVYERILGLQANKAIAEPEPSPKKKKKKKKKATPPTE